MEPRRLLRSNSHLSDQGSNFGGFMGSIPEAQALTLKFEFGFKRVS